MVEIRISKVENMVVKSAWRGITLLNTSFFCGGTLYRYTEYNK